MISPFCPESGIAHSEIESRFCPHCQAQLRTSRSVPRPEASDIVRREEEGLLDIINLIDPPSSPPKETSQTALFIPSRTIESTPYISTTVLSQSRRTIVPSTESKIKAHSSVAAAEAIRQRGYQLKKPVLKNLETDIVRSSDSGTRLKLGTSSQQQQLINATLTCGLVRYTRDEFGFEKYERGLTCKRTLYQAIVAIY
jgi:hypothetical protein